MPRVIPIAIANHIDGGSTTMCMLIRVMPVQPGFSDFGITTLDADVHYDDGDGELLYSSAIGAEISALQASSDTGAAVGETKQLMPVFDTPLTEAQLKAGACDYARFIAYLVNFEDLSAGHVIIRSGTLGRHQETDSGLSWTSELRGLAQNLKQTITEKWSLACRAVFGSTVTSAQSRCPCNFDIEPLWENGTVTAVGTDTTQLFQTTGLSPTFGGAPGLVEWLTGANAGRSDEVESFDQIVGPGDVPQTIGLTFGSSYPIQKDDLFRFRDDCPKTPVACKARDNYPNYRGEPSIPVSDSGVVTVGTGSIVSASTIIPPNP